MGDLDTDELYVVAACLHPMYKLRWCQGSKEPNRTRDQTKALLLRRLSAILVELSKREDEAPAPRLHQLRHVPRSPGHRLLVTSPRFDDRRSTRGAANVSSGE